MFNILRRRLDRWLTASQLGERYVKFQELLGQYVKEDGSVGTARAILETVCEAETKWPGDEGLALRIAIDANHGFGFSFNPEFDNWVFAANFAHEHFKTACHAAINAFSDQVKESLSDPAALADLRKAKDSLASTLAKQGLRDYIRTRYNREI